MPQQVVRLAIVFLALAAALVVARTYLIPETFGQLGHYRAAAVEANASKPLVYAGREDCAVCHTERAEEFAKGRHQNLSCEVCHGAAAGHIESPSEHKPPAPRDRGYCPLCHGYNPSRPTGFPQIDPVSHNPGAPCIKCHNPHAPEPPRTPQECSACHGEIARTKTLSAHATLECTQCHQVEERHKTDPRLSTPSKPKTREFCVQCHGADAKSAPEVKRIDLAEHWPRYVCWQCHYSHYPEVR
jgi:DnaJ-class molecular chaperone